MEASARQANYLFNIYTFENNEPRDHLGGTGDLATAVTFAAAHYTAKQSSTPATGFGVGIDQDGVGLVAYMGWHVGDD